MPTSKKPLTHKEEVFKATPTVNVWLDATTSQLCVETANGMLFEIPLTPEEFEKRRKEGARVIK